MAEPPSGKSADTFEPPRGSRHTLREEDGDRSRAWSRTAQYNPDSSTTVLAMAQSLTDDDAKATVCTDDLEIAEVLSARQNTELIVLGSVSGPAR